MPDARVIDVRRDDARDAALARAADGDLVVLVASGDDALGRAGDLAREVVDAGGRVAVFDGTLSDENDHEAVAEMLAELDVRE